MIFKTDYRLLRTEEPMVSYRNRWHHILIIFGLLFLFVFHYCRFHSTPYDDLEPFGSFEDNGNRTALRGYVSINFSRGRLANNLFEFCSLYAISRYLKRVPVLYVKDKVDARTVGNMEELMPELVRNIEYRTVEDNTNVLRIDFHKKCCAFDNPAKLAKYREKHIHLNGYFYQSYKYFNHHREEIRNFLRLDNNFSSLPESNPDNFILCIHIRRTDFIKEKRYSAGKDFIVAARDFIRERENQPNLTTVLIGDDPKFESDIFKNESNVFVSHESPNRDMIYSRLNCDSILYTAPSSTFGWWISYLSKGERVYYIDIETTNDPVYKSGEIVPTDFFDPRWTPLKFDNKTNKVSLSTPFYYESTKI